MPSTSVLTAIVLGLAPGFEPRYTLLLLAAMLGTAPAIAIAVVEVVMLSLALSLLVEKLEVLLERMGPRMPAAWLILERARRLAEKHRGLVERYGALGLAAFVAIPLPFTGMYTGSLVALILGFTRKERLVSLLAGGLASLVLVSTPLIAAENLL
ncbi:small multi-drug export protein [Hyperthermus butylicus]|uniref:Membrane protein n=1 Tax=Hyperthermus butylicus (strain DSM 5456 / JCM 9403 / PLM1-5) TaxID=415426 RepID=A2BKD3_HYPBU|nr:small multi-drug export protein [Hyperthermus butylicus]ABM80444.1 putative membrane protein [Hyperthermus butylicus DSM 5456]